MEVGGGVGGVVGVETGGRVGLDTGIAVVGGFVGSATWTGKTFLKEMKSISELIPRSPAKVSTS